MAGSTSPVEVGTRGTIGSLVSQEIEYFRRLRTDHQRSSQRSKKVIKDMTSSNMGSANKKKKKKAVESNNGGFLPSICSVVEINDAGGAGYINLRADGNKLM